MFGKIIFVALLGLVLVHAVPTGEVATDNYRSTIEKCETGQQDDDVARLCIMKDLGIMNDNGEFDFKKLEELLKTDWGYPENAEIIAGNMQCAREATGATPTEKSKSFAECTGKKKELRTSKIFQEKKE